MHKQIIIIGSGLAGLMAGRKLTAAGCEVLILDKGRRMGGRMATRRDQGWLFNHGAQFVTARSALFSQLCRTAERQQILARWPESGRMHAFCGRPAMRDLASFLGRGLAITQEIEISAIEQHRAGGFTLETQKGATFSCDHLIVTAPAPQTAALLRVASPLLAETAEKAVYAPCWTVMLGLDQTAGIVPVLQPPDGPIGWAACEAARPNGGPSGAVTIHAAADFSQSCLEADPQQIISQLQAHYFSLQGGISPVCHYARAHRWRYARVLRPAPPSAPFFEVTAAGGFAAVGGDWHPQASDTGPASGARAEEAGLSGQRAAEALLAALSSAGLR